jgi:hypothetical protein
MTSAERLAEVAELLAVGIQRLLARECKALEQPRNHQEQVDDAGRVEAPCPT